MKQFFQKQLSDVNKSIENLYKKIDLFEKNKVWGSTLTGLRYRRQFLEGQKVGIEMCFHQWLNKRGNDYGQCSTNSKFIVNLAVTLKDKIDSCNNVSIHMSGCQSSEMPLKTYYEGKSVGMSEILIIINKWLDNYNK